VLADSAAAGLGAAGAAATAAPGGRDVDGGTTAAAAAAAAGDPGPAAFIGSETEGTVVWITVGPGCVLSGVAGAGGGGDCWARHKPGTNRTSQCKRIIGNTRRLRQCFGGVLCGVFGFGADGVAGVIPGNGTADCGSDADFAESLA
jgi:hypothetical protein